MRSGSRTSEGWALGFSGEPGSEKESRTWDVQVISELGFVGVRSGGLSRGLGAVESWEQGLSWAVGSWVASWGGERHRGWGSVREELGSPLLLGSAEAVEDWDGEMISGLASEGSWEVGCFEALVASEGWGVCRGGRPTERDRGWGPGGFSSSACHLHLPGCCSGWPSRSDYPESRSANPVLLRTQGSCHPELPLPTVPGHPRGSERVSWVRMGSLRYLPQTSCSEGSGVLGPTSPGVPAPHFQHCSLPLPWSLTPPPGTQKVSLPAGVSCWGEGAGSAKDRFGGWGLRSYRIRGFCEGGSGRPILGVVEMSGWRPDGRRAW